MGEAEILTPAVLAWGSPHCSLVCMVWVLF